MQNVSEMGIREPTEVQLQCIPRILKGDDVIGQAKTGSGKTAAFALPILQKLSEDPFGVFAIVLTPSRELACQISDQFVAFAAHTNFSIVTIVGGVDMMKQSVRLRHFPQIIIATPGRLGAACLFVSPNPNRIVIIYLVCLIFHYAFPLS